MWPCIVGKLVLTIGPLIGEALVMVPKYDHVTHDTQFVKSRARMNSWSMMLIGMNVC